MIGVPRSKVVRGFSFFGASFVYIIFEDGTDIYWARSRVLEYLSAADSAPARRRVPDARAGRHRRRLGLPVRRHRRQSLAGRIAHVAGLVHPLPAVEGARRVRGRVDRRLRAAVRRHRRSAQAAGVQPAAVEDHRDDPHEQPRRRRPDRRDVGDRVHGARHRLPARRRGSREADRACREGRAGAALGRRTHRARAGRAARHRRAERQRRGGRRHRGRALRHARHRRHRQRQAAHQGDRPPACRKASRSRRSTTARN